MATQSDRITALEEGMAAILAAVQGKSATTQDDAPVAKATPKDRAKATASRADTVKRNLDPVDFTDDDGNGVQVAPSGKTGLYRRGSRVRMVRGGRTAVGSLTRDEVQWLVANAEDVLASMDAVDEAAKIGEHLA